MNSPRGGSPKKKKKKKKRQENQRFLWRKSLETDISILCPDIGTHPEKKGSI
jgi:hypothetical protein